jgi:hypothetical protein
MSTKPKTLVLHLFGLLAACGCGGFGAHPPVNLAFTVQPTGAFAGVAMKPMAVTVQDGLGNTVSSASMNITVAIGSNAGSGTLSGTTTVAAVGGVATFSDLMLDKSGAGYTLTASANGATVATSSPFDVAPEWLRFAGTWTGTRVIQEAFTGPPEEYVTTTIGVPYGDAPQRIVIVLTGNSMTVAGICPTGAGNLSAWADPTGTITFNVSSDSATWSGSYACPAVPGWAESCPSVPITYSNGTAILNGAHLTVVLTGSVAGSGSLCSETGTITVTFSS